MTKRLFIITVLFTCIFSFKALADNAASAENIYLYAKNFNVAKLSKIKNIDIKNANGKSAYCLAKQNKDERALKLLGNYGADKNQDCKNKKILTSKTMGYGALAVLATGGAVAIGSGGGGSSGSDKNKQPVLNCIHGTQQENVCACNAGWEGATCETPKTCSYNTIACSEGYEETGNTCQSGDVIYKECKTKTVPEGYTKDRCYDGYTQTDTFLSGDEIYYYCQANDCNGFASECSDNEYETGRTCKSGNTILKECKEHIIISNCEEYNHTVANTCAVCSGNLTGAKCDTCKENFTGENCQYAKLECKNGGIQNNDSCINCNDGWTGTTCETAVTCGSNYKLNCETNEYATGNTCLSGSNTLTECLVHRDMPNCQTPSTTSDTCDTCKTGYTGSTCDIRCATVDEEGNCIKVGTSNSKNMSTISLDNDDKHTTLYGMKGSALYNAYGDTNGTPGASGTIKLVNNNGGDVYGMYSKGNIAYNASIGYTNRITGLIDIQNTNSGNVYGIYAYSGINIDGYSQFSSDKATIKINNVNSGDAYGIYAYGSTGLNAVNSKDSGIGIIEINNIGDNNIYGIYSPNSNASNSTSGNGQGIIRIQNAGNGAVYGIYGKGYAYNIATTKTTKDMIHIKNNGTGKVYGMYSEGIVENRGGNINIIQLGSGHAYGLYGNATYNFAAHFGSEFGEWTGEGRRTEVPATIEMINCSNGLTAGIYAKDGTITNSNTITIHNLGSGTAVGIYADGNTRASNSGTITIDRENYTDNNAGNDTSDGVSYTKKSDKGGKAIGIYAEAGATVANSGTIIIKDAENAYGIYSEGGKSSVTNTGTIIIDDVSCTSSNCAMEEKNSSKQAIVLNGGKLLQDGNLISTTNLDLNAMGGNIFASAASRFKAKENISGTLNLNDNIVMQGFKDEYRVNDMIEAKDVSNLKLKSQSALFNASLENGTDAVLSRKNFAEVSNNKSLATFLEKNYASQNNEKLFNTVKSFETVSQLNHGLDVLMGKDMFTRFAFEDLTMMRELNFEINNKLFNNNKDSLSVGGNITSFAFDGKSRYSLSNIQKGKHSLGISIAFSDISSKDNNNHNYRNERLYNIAMPVGFDNKNGAKLISTPRFGYADGTYNRKGLNSRNHNGNINKQMFGLMNEARYPIKFGDWLIAPSIEFNVINYHIKGTEGSSNPYTLMIKSQNMLSAETGFGIYVNKKNDLNKNTSLSFNGGVAIYHEFADPYKMKIGVSGMDGTFTLRDENRSNNRAVIRTGFDFKHNDITVDGKLMSYIDREYCTDAVLNMKFNF